MKTLNNKKILLSIFATMIAGCNNVGSSTTNIPNTAIADNGKHLKRERADISPGYGFSRLSDEISSGRCYKATAHQTNMQSVFDQSVEFGAKNFQKKMDVAFSGGMTLGNPFASFDSAANYVSSQRDSLISTSMYMTVALKRTVSVTPDEEADSIWTPYGQGQLDLYLNSDDKEKALYNFIKHCGGYMINSYDEIGMLIIKVTFTFRSAEENNKFKLNYEFKNLFAHTDGHIETEFNSSEFHGSVTVSARQFGGDIAELASLPSNANGFATCDISNLYNCDQLLTSYLEYGQDFGGQFQEDHSGDNSLAVYMVPTGSLVVGDSFSEYADIPEEPVADQMLLDQRNSLMADKEMLDNGYEILSNFLVESNPIARNSLVKYNQLNYVTQYFNKLSTLRNEINSNSGIDVSSTCWSDPKNCSKVADKFHNKLKNFQIYLLNLKSTDTSAVESISHEMAIVDLDDSPEYGTNLHYIRIFNLQKGTYVGKIPYLAESTNVFDNVGRSIAAGFAQEPTANYNNGYFFSALGKVELNPFEYNLPNLLMGRSYRFESNEWKAVTLSNDDKKYINLSFYKIHDPSSIYWAYDGIDDRLPTNKIYPVPNINSYLNKNARLIISKRNPALEYIGNGEIVSHALRVSESQNFAEYNVDPLDPTGLTAARQTKLADTTGEIYYTPTLLDETGYLETSNSSFVVPPRGTVSIKTVQSNVYHQGTRLPHFKLEVSILGNDKSGYDPL